MNDNNSPIGYNLYNLEPQFKSYLSAGKDVSPHSIKNYLSDFRYFAGWVQSRRISTHANYQNRIDTEPLLGTDLIQGYRDYLLAERLSFRTINRRLSTLRKFCRFALSQGLVKENFGNKLANVLPENGEILDLFNIKASFSDLKSITDSTIRTYIQQLEQKNSPKEEIAEKIHNLIKYIAWAYKNDKIEYSHYQQLKDEIAKNDHYITSQSGDKEYQEAVADEKPDTKQESPDKPNRLLNNHPGTTEMDLNSTGVQKYVALAFILILTTILGGSIYQKFFREAPLTLALQSSPLVASRTLLFQGKLTDSLGNPIIEETNIRFGLYNASGGGTTLYNSGSCSIRSDFNGTHRAIIGSDCGKSIAASIFTENPEVWLGITVGSDSEMSPRQQIANFAYAANSQSLQGLAPGSNRSSIPFISQGGELLIATENPTIHSSYASESFLLSSAKSIMIQSAGSGDVALAATQSGSLKFITRGSQAMVIDNSGKVGINNPSPSQELEVNGNIATSGQLRLGRFSSNPDSIGAGSIYYNTTDDSIYYYDNDSWVKVGISSGSDNRNWQINGGALSPISSNMDILTGSIATTSALVRLPGISGENGFFNSGGNFGIGTSSPEQKLHVNDSQSANSSALIENASASPDADGLAMKLGFTGSGSISNYFATFLNGLGHIQGKIQSNGSNGVSYTTTGADFAEYFPITNVKSYVRKDIPNGSLICQYQDGAVGPCDEENDHLIGVVSSRAGFVGSSDKENDSHYILVGLVGQIRLNISEENGPIKQGDPLTSSKTAGKAAKANKPGRIIGFSQDTPTMYNGQKGVETTIQPTFYDPGYILTDQGFISPFEQIQERLGAIELNPSAGTLLSDIGIVLSQETGRIKHFVTESFEATNAVIDTLIVDKITAKSITTDSFNAQEASISGKLVAKEIDSENIREFRQRLEKAVGEQVALTTSASQLAVNNEQLTASSSQLQSEVKEIKQYLDELNNGTYTDVKNIDSFQEVIEDISVNNLTATGHTNLYTATVADTFSAGNIFIKDSQILSLTSELALNALDSVNVLNGAVVIARDGTMNVKGEIIARGGIKTNKISPISSGDDVAVTLDSGNLSVRNAQSGAVVASIDASGSAHFSNLSLDKYDQATASGVIIAARENFEQYGIFSPAIETNAASTGNGRIPGLYENLVIYNDKITDDSLVYITPTSPTGNQQLYVAEKRGCNNKPAPCKPYFKIAIDGGSLHSDATFNWWVVN